MCPIRGRAESLIGFHPPGHQSALHLPANPENVPRGENSNDDTGDDDDDEGENCDDDTDDQRDFDH